MPRKDAVLEKVRAICLSLPDTKETPTWGKPHFRVGEKIFAGYGVENGKTVVGFKLHMHHADAVIKDPRFERAPYVGHKGWVSMNAEGVKDWDVVREMILESYRLIASKKSLARLEGAEPARGAKAAKPARKAIAKKARKPAAKPARKAAKRRP